MRLIDADALFETLVTGDIRETHQFCYPCKKVLEAIDAQPTVEAISKERRMTGAIIFAASIIALAIGWNSYDYHKDLRNIAYQLSRIADALEQEDEG